MNNLTEDLKRYETSGLAMLLWLTLVSSVLVTTSVIKVVIASSNLLLAWSLLALLLLFTASRQVIRFPGTHSGVSLAETFTFLAIITIGPYHAVLLTLLAVLLASHRLKLRPSLYFFNVANHTLSVYVAAEAYYATRDILRLHFQTQDLSERIVIFAIPLMIMALTHYLLHILILALMSYFTYATKMQETFAGSLPWEPVTFLAAATIAGVVKIVYHGYGITATIITLLLVSPVLILIYYAFKTYRDNLMERENHYKELTNIYDSILEMLAMAIDAKDDVTHDHIHRVKHFARRMGEIVGLETVEIEALKAGALLHDIGKIGVPAYILNKPGKLSEHEFEQMKLHTIIGADMLSNIDFRYPVVPIVRHHHERWDGCGYPDGLKGEQIPITARILTLVDNYDALRSDRPYHKAMSREEALEYIQKNAGVFFDPSLVEIFLGRIDELEVEAASFKSQVKKFSGVDSLALKAATPAAGLDNSSRENRVHAVLNSIAESNQRVSALYELARNLAGAFSLEDTTAILTNRLSKIIPFTTCAVSLFDPSL